MAVHVAEINCLDCLTRRILKWLMVMIGVIHARKSHTPFRHRNLVKCIHCAKDAIAQIRVQAQSVFPDQLKYISQAVQSVPKANTAQQYQARAVAECARKARTARLELARALHVARAIALRAAPLLELLQVLVQYAQLGTTPATEMRAARTQVALHAARATAPRASARPEVALRHARCVPLGTTPVTEMRAARTQAALHVAQATAPRASARPEVALRHARCVPLGTTPVTEMRAARTQAALHVARATALLVAALLDLMHPHVHCVRQATAAAQLLVRAGVTASQDQRTVL